MNKEDNQNRKIGIHMTKEEQKKYNKWTKIQIYEAYMHEEQLRKQLMQEQNELRRKLAEVRYLIR